MAASIPVVRGFDPTDPKQVSGLRQPTDNVNAADAWQYIHPKDLLFGHNGTVIRGKINGRGHSKILWPLRRLEDIQAHLRTNIRDIRTMQMNGRTVLLQQRKDRYEALVSAGMSEETIKEELADVDAQIASLGKFPVVAFQVVSVAPFKNSIEALSGKHQPVSVNTYAIVKEFEKAAEVEKLNTQIRGRQSSLPARTNFIETPLDGYVVCRDYPGTKVDDDLIYLPVWHVL